MKKKNSFSSSYRYVNTMTNLNTNLNLKLKNKNFINSKNTNNINIYDKKSISRSKSNNKKNNNNLNNNIITKNTLIMENNKNSIKNENSNKNILYHKTIPNNKMLFDKHNSITVKKKQFFSKSKIVNKTQINSNNNEINNNNNNYKHKKSFSNKNNSFNNNIINKLKNSFSINTNNNYYNYNNNIKINKIISPDISLNKSLPKYDIKNNNIINNIKKNNINLNDNNNKLCTSNSFISHTSKLSSKIKLKKNLIHKEKLKNLKINTNPIISIINNKMNTLNNINTNTISNNYNNNINTINNKKNNNKNSISISNRAIRIDNQTLQTNPNKLPIKIKNEFSNYFSARNHNKSKNIIIKNDNSNSNIFKINNNNSLNNNNKHNIIINHKKACSNNMYFKAKINPSFRTLNKNILINNNLKKSNINIDIEINTNINKNNNVHKNNLNKNEYKKKKPNNNKEINNVNDNSINNIINNNININANKTSMKLSKNTKSKSQNVFSNKINESNYHTFNSPISTKLSPTIKKQWEKNLLSINNNNKNNIETDFLNFNEFLLNSNSPIKKINSLNIYKNNIINNNNKINLISSNFNINNNNNILKRIMKIDSRTIAGFSSPQDQKINQDNFFIEKDYLGQSEHFFLGVCDGHGINGHLISEYISNYLPDFITDSSDPKNITNGFIKCNNALTTSTDIDCTLSGSTCVSLFISLDKIICANIGDSRAVLARYENGNYNTIKISRDHKPTEFDEMKRILENNGRIEKYYDTDFDAFVGPKRIWLKNNDIPGLAMTRSFGDVIGHNVGVTSEPEITKTIFNGSERFAIIASDGIWEYIDSEESVEIVKEFYENDMDANGAVESLVKEAFSRWKREEDTVDDITAIVVFFEE